MPAAPAASASTTPSSITASSRTPPAGAQDSSSPAAGSKEATPRPALKRRIVIEVQPAKKAPAEAASPAGGGGGSPRRSANCDRACSAIASDPALDLKKFTIDLDFALERDGKGAMQLVLFARDKRIDPANVHGLKLRLAADAAPPKEKDPRGKEASAKEKR